MAHILFYPAFPDLERLYDQLYRSIWHFSPMAGRINKITFAFSGPATELLEGDDCLLSASSRMSPDFDPDIVNFAPDFLGRISIIPESELLHANDSVDAIFVWNAAVKQTVKDAQGIGQAQKADVVVVDPNSVQQETLAAIKFAYSLWSIEELDSLVAESYSLFQEHATKWKGRSISAFGNGPSLSATVSDKVDLGDSVRAVCNSTICDEQSILYLNPELLFCGDPVQHCGVSRYAGDFRRGMAKALENPKRVLFTQLGYVPYFRSVTPQECHNRIIGIGNDRRPKFNLNLEAEYLSAATANIFTMLVLPVACTLTKNIDIYGCDGMPFREASNPWQHANEMDYSKSMSVTHRVHKSFWNRNYEEEYWSYCRDLSDILATAEQDQYTIRVRTPSFVPALASRFTDS
ncbi:MAG: hypothetical protein RIB43_13935 [Rhodospirillaceae bacterium]